MAEHEKSLVKSSNALMRFDPKARKELVVRALNAITEVKDADFYFFKGEEHRNQGQLKKAIENYERALQLDPEHEDSLFWTGWCYLPIVKGNRSDDINIDHPARHKKAIAAFQKLIAIHKKKDSIWWGNYVTYYNLSISQCNLGLYEEAIESCGKSIELNPDHADSYKNLGSSQYGLGLYKEAIESFEQSIELNPDDANSYYNLGLSQDALGIYHLALENFEVCLSLNSLKTSMMSECIKHAKTRIEQLKGLLTDTYFFNIGYRFWKKNEYKQAIECYSRAIELNPDFADSYYMLGLVQYTLDLHEEAIESYEQAKELNPEDVKVYYALALSQDALEIYHLALENFETYLNSDPPEKPERPECIKYAKNRIEQLKGLLF